MEVAFRMASTKGSIKNQRALIIEDEPLVALLLEETLTEIGCRVVAVAPNFDDAMEKAKSLEFDVAVVDLNLNGRQTVPILQILDHCRRPFVISTGYGTSNLPVWLRDKPVLQK